MYELLFFLFGLVIGGLSGITMMCMLQCAKMADEKIIDTPRKKL